MTAKEMAHYLEPYAGSVDVDVCDQLLIYLELLMKWNARTNLTAIREPVEIVRRHFGESLFVARYLGRCESLLDFGSGAGFPGLPIQLLRKDLPVTLAESQGKKAAFLHEMVRVLNLRSEVWAARVETLQKDKKFDVVAMRAVDRMETAVSQAILRARKRVLILGSNKMDYPQIGGFTKDKIVLPGRNNGILLVATR